MKPQIKALIIVVVVIFLGLGAYILSDDSSGSSDPTPTTTSQNSEVNNNAGLEQNPTAVLTTEEVNRHNKYDDCWTIISGDVYDITDYVPRHPGGDEILKACGQDGTSLFTTRKTDEGEVVGSGTPHSAGASSQLERYYLGALAE